MRRKLSVFVISALFLAVADMSTASTPIAIGSSCSKVQATSKIHGVDAMCTKLGRARTWQVNTFSQLTSQWVDIKKIELSKPVPTVSFQVMYSPTVNKEMANKILAALTDASRFWQDRYLPKTPMPILFLTEKDRAWYLSTLTSIGQNQQELDDKSSAFDEEVAHNGNKANAAGLAGRSDDQYFQFFIGTGTTGTNLYSLQVAAHEYTHAGQGGFEDPSPFNYAPCWMIEGSAVYYGGALASKTTSDLKFFRNVDVWSKQQQNFPGLAYEPKIGWSQFIDQNGPRDTNPNYGATCGLNGTYQVGSIATSYLYSLKGNQGILDFLDLSASLRDYKAAAAQVYGISWEALRDAMANYIRLVVAQTPFFQVN